MFLDLTPGTPEIYRRDLLTKLFTIGYDVICRVDEKMYKDKKSKK